MITAKELREKSDQELHAALAAARTELHELSFKAATKQLKEVSKLQVIKRDIARCLTILRERRTLS